MIEYKKVSIWYSSLVLVTLFASLQAEFLLLDQGVVVVSGPVANTMITHSDIAHKLNLDGSPMSAKQLIEWEVINQDVRDSKMPFDDTAADKYLANVQKMNNLSLDDLENLAAQCERTFYELKQLLTYQYTYDFFLYHKFRAHLVPSDQDVEDYCAKHPEVQPGHCVIQVAFVDYNQSNKELVQEKINGIIAGTVHDDAVEWSDPIKVNVVDIADDKLFITKMQLDAIHVIEDKNVFELYRLVDKKDEYVVPVADRKAFVVDTLNRQMYEDLLRKYQEHMIDNVAIIELV